MGLSAYRAGRYAQAIEYLQKSISENPPETMKLFYLGLSQAKNKDYQAARTSFEEIIRLLPPTSDFGGESQK